MSRTKKIQKDSINVDKAFDIHSKICDREVARRALLLDNIKDLVWMFETQSYKAILGFDPPPKWSGYLGMVEMYYSRAEVERWRKIYSYFNNPAFEIDKLMKLPVTRLEDIARLNPDIPTAIDLVAQAEVLSSLDWKNTLAEKAGKPTSWDCQHTFKIQEHCTRCGLNHEIDAGNEQNNKKV